ncbi:MBOAT, membrane-bound O-acyltransferase family-domain-containing protein [Tuber indicum]|nr:MBOAT, membrane-bound O-acyltransferase family-domain-containing protein [Tuber indicum]
MTQFNKLTMSQRAPSTSNHNTPSTAKTHTFLFGELQTTTSSDPPSPESASPTSDFDDARLSANPTEKPVVGLGVGGENGEREFQEQVGRRASIPVRLEKIRGKERYRLVMDDELGKLLVSGSVVRGKKRKKKFSDLVFTKRFTAFDRRSPEAASSPFRGFYTVFWMSVVILILKLAATSYKEQGRLFGIDILSMMFNPNNLIDCLLVDATMFWGSTLWCVPLQKAVAKGRISWERTGWVLQMVWEAVYLGAVIEYTLWKDWPWIQTVFVVLHCLVMLMKQHSYAFYNGHLSGVCGRLRSLERKLVELRALDTSESNARHHVRAGSADSGVDIRGGSEEELDSTQVEDFERAIMEEIAACNGELSSYVEDNDGPRVVYPQNLTWWNYFEYIHFPTVVYELVYPRTTTINWPYVLEKTTATFGVLGIMIVVSQHLILPVVLQTHTLRLLPLSSRLQAFPYILLDLIFPFMIEYLMAWYLIWELILNALAELTFFADRGFYGPWWNSTTWDAFARDWNKPVHNFLLRHVYHSSISTWHVSRGTATVITFLLSAIVHELVMWSLFKRLRGYLLVAQMLQVPLVYASRTKLLKGRETLGNVIFWLGIYTGPSFLCSLYLII